MPFRRSTWIGSATAVIVLASCGVGGGGGGPYKAEINKWKFFCGHIATRPDVAFDAEVSGKPTRESDFLFSYLLSEPPDNFPSQVRQEMVTLRTVVADRRAGTITTEQARGAGVPGVEALRREDLNGGCSWLRSRPEGLE